MGIGIEQIDEMRKRTNCSYQEAKELLEKHNGDLIDAIVDFEKNHGSRMYDKNAKEHKGGQQKNNDHAKSFGSKVKELIQKGFVTRFSIEKDANVILNIPVNILIIAVLVTMPIFWIYVIAFIAMYFMGYKIRIRKQEGGDVDLNEMMDDLSSKVRTAADKMTEKPAAKAQPAQAQTQTPDVQKKDGYNEITIE